MCLRPREQGGASGDEVGYSVNLAMGDAIANGEDLDLLDPRRRAEFDDVTLMRFHQALATGDSQLTWPRPRSASSTPTIVIVISVPRPVA